MSTVELMRALLGPGRQRRPVGAVSAVSLLVGLWWIRKRLAAAAKARAAKLRGLVSKGYDLETANRDLYIKLPNGSRTLLVPNRSGVSQVTIHQTKPSTYATHRQEFLKSPPGTTPTSANNAATTANKVGVNKEFSRQLRALLRIIVPRKRSKEVILIIAHSTFLLLRTYLSLLVAKLDGKLVGDLVSANGRGFLNGLVLWFALAIPSVYTNSMIRFLQQKLSISFRTRLTRYVHDLYLSSNANYYRMLHLDNRIDSADQYIATDVARFCDSLAALYSNLAKPVIDLILFNIQLGRSIGKWGSLGLAASYVATAWILRRVTPAFGKLAAVEARLEGEFRGAHARVIVNAEEIAFYQGQPTELDLLNRAYLRLIKHVNSIFKIRIAYSMIEDLVVKYLWSACGYLLISIPVFFGPKPVKALPSHDPDADAKDRAHHAGRQIAARTEAYISNRRLLLSLADAGGRLMYSYKDLAELAGYTSRVFSLISTLHSLDSGKVPRLPRPSDLAPELPYYDLGDLHGQFNRVPGSVEVRFEGVPIVAPAPGVARGGEELVKPIGLTIKEGDHLLITGPNGSGKTSVARVLAGLWPVFKGVVDCPEDKDILFLPQRPYLSSGSLRDQIIYPHAYPDFIASGKTEADLLDVLEHVHLAYLPGREGGLDTVKEWKDVLSGGEKQRMGLARLFYHHPKFGVLDECTSAVSTDVEGSMYAHAKDVGITLITISHRPSLFKYHKHLLRLSGGGEAGGWEVSVIGTEEEHLSFQREVDSLDEKLAEVSTWEERLEEVELELAQSTAAGAA